jgi:hypothetical protein
MYKFIGFFIRDVKGNVVTFSLTSSQAKAVCNQNGLPHSHISTAYEFITNPVYVTPGTEFKGEYVANESTGMFDEDHTPPTEVVEIAEIIEKKE